MKSRTFLGAVIVVSLTASAKEPPVVGLTQAASGAIRDFGIRVEEIARIAGHCETIEEIRTSALPVDYAVPEEMKGHVLELWTAIGCRREFPVLVEWTAGRHGSYNARFRKFRW